MDNELRIAILIDADNVSDKYIKIIVDEVANIGIATYKRIYGDWTSARLSSWKKVLLEDSIIPIQQYSYTTGKNATDSAMIIDAMDILYTRSVEGFCIVSSDSDFTRLASRIRESGLTVIGMGEKKTPTPFRKACDIFTTLELLLGDAGGKASGRGKGRGDQAGANAAGAGAGTTGADAQDGRVRPVCCREGASARADGRTAGRERMDARSRRLGSGSFQRVSPGRGLRRHG